MKTKNYLQICSQSLLEVCQHLHDLEEVLFQDPALCKHLSTRSPNSLQTIDQSQQKLTFLSQLLQEIGTSTDPEIADNVITFLNGSNLQSMSMRFLSVNETQ